MKPYIGIVTDRNEGTASTYSALIVFQYRDQMYALPRHGNARFVPAPMVEHAIDVELDTDVFPPKTLEMASLGDFDSRTHVYRWWDSLSQDGKDEFFGTH